MALISRNYRGLEGEFKNAGKGSGFVGTQGFKGFRNEPISTGSLIRVEGFEASFGF